MKIAITGSIAFDYIMRYPRTFKEMLLAESLDNLSVSFLVDEMTKHRGGVGPNIAYTMALLGAHPYLVGTAGQDFANYRKLLEEVGVNTSGIRQIDELFTASFFVSTDSTQNQIAMFYTGAMSHARDLALKDALAISPDLVVISPNDPIAMDNYIEECKTRQIPYMYDPGQQVARSDGEWLARAVDGAHILIVNDFEHTALCRKTGYSHDDLMRLTDVVVVTRGKNGSDIYLPDSTYHIPVVETTHLADPTGAGDGYRGGLLRGLVAGWGWEIAGQMGALAATYVLEHTGTQNHQYTIDQFVKRFRKHFDDNGRLDDL